MKRFAALILACAIGVVDAPAADKKPMKDSSSANPEGTAQSGRITFGGGCFWCIEAVFARFDGVKSAVSGYAGGKTPNPTYRQICEGNTGHAEVVQITFDPDKTSYEKMLEIFWAAHDPTTLNRQGMDVGTQYRSVIFYETDAEKAAAQKSKQAAQADFRQPIVTEVARLEKFYPAEDYHQDYFEINGRAPYCQAVIAPKLRELIAKGKIREKVVEK